MNGALRVGFLLAGAGVSSLAAARPDVNAFLNKPAVTTRALLAQIKTDKAVADRYCRHFAMNRADVLAYLSQMMPTRTRQDALYTIYSVPEDGRLKAHTKIVRAGTPIFADITGKPALIMKCGNPLTKGPRQPESPNEAVADLVDEEKITLRDAAQDEFASIPELVAEDTPLEPAVGELPAEETTPTVTQGGSPNQILPSGGNPFNLALGSIGMGAVILGSSLGGGSSPPVPEPATIVAMAAGIAYLALRRRRA